MTYVVAQLSDTHIGGPVIGSAERMSLAIDAINEMGRQPDRVLFTGDLTHDSTPEQWAEFTRRADILEIPWTAIAGNHDHTIGELAGHRTLVDGPLRFVLVDSSNEVFDTVDAEWLDHTLSAHPNDRTVIAIHHPPFETGIWWMDRLGMRGAQLFEAVVRRHAQVFHVLSGHVHRPIHTAWGSCTLWVCPSTSVSIAIDVDPEHDPAETDEGPTFGLHDYTSTGVVSHIVPVGPASRRTSIESKSPGFVEWLRRIGTNRPSQFS